jgi:hypothetical protein
VAVNTALNNTAQEILKTRDDFEKKLNHTREQTEHEVEKVQLKVLRIEATTKAPPAVAIKKREAEPFIPILPELFRLFEKSSDIIIKMKREAEPFFPPFFPPYFPEANPPAIATPERGWEEVAELTANHHFVAKREAEPEAKPFVLIPMALMTFDYIKSIVSG